MKAILKGLFSLAVVAVLSVGCGSKDADIYAKSIDLSAHQSALDGISGAAGDKIKAATAALASDDIKGGLTALIEGVQAKGMDNAQMEAVMGVYEAVSGYLAGKPELRTPEIIKLEQQFSNVWAANYKG